MNAREVIADTEQRGFRLALVGDTVDIIPPLDKAVPEALTAAVRPHRDEIIRILHQRRGDASSTFQTYTAADLKALPPPEFRAELLVPDGGFATIIGKSGHMKTFYALDLSLSVATGRTFHGRAVVPGSVLYVAAEGRAGLGQRIAAWEAARFTAVGDAFRAITEAPALLDAAQVDALIATIRKHGSEVLLLDTLNLTLNGNENDPRDMAGYVAAVKRIQRECGVTVIVVHHMGWNGDHGRGHSSLYGAVDAQITITKDGETVTAKVTKAKDFPDGDEMTFTARVVPLANGGSSCVLDTAMPTAVALSGSAKRIGAVLHETFGAEGATATQWQRVCGAKGLDDSAFYRGRTELANGGYLHMPPDEKAKRGWRYTATDTLLTLIGQREQGQNLHESDVIARPATGTENHAANGITFTPTMKVTGGGNPLPYAGDTGAVSPSLSLTLTHSHESGSHSLSSLSHPFRGESVKGSEGLDEASDEDDEWYNAALDAAEGAAG